MTKKKNKDFQKVRIKVGRQLKRRNETVIDLTKKKIILPKERKKQEDTGVAKSESQIIDDSISSLNIENVSVRLNSIQTINRTLDSFVKRLSNLIANDYSILTVPHRNINQTLELYKTLFGIQSSSSWSLQLGNLVHTVSRLCRNSQDLRLCSEILKLFTGIINIVCCHPKCLDVLASLDLTAVNLLQRNESHWCWLGVRLTNLVITTHRQLFSTLSLLRSASCPTNSQIYLGLVDSTQLLVRYRAYSRLLLRSFKNLKNWCSLKDLPNERLSLLQATMNVLKDHQYIAFLLMNDFHHPWCRTVPWTFEPNVRQTCLYLPLNGYCFGEISQIFPESASLNSTILVIEKMPLLKNQVPSVTWRSDERRAKKSRGSFNRDMVVADSTTMCTQPLGQQQMMDDRNLALNLLEEGFVLMDGLSVNQTELAYRSLYYIIRALRVMFETKNPEFFTSSKTEWSENSTTFEKRVDLYDPLSKFLTRMFELSPFTATISDSSPSSSAETSSSSSTSIRLVDPRLRLKPDMIPLTRKEFHQQRKRAKKLMRRQTRGSNLDNMPGTDLPEEVTNMNKEAKLDRRQSDPDLSKLIQLTHRLDQCVLELFTFVELIYLKQLGDGNTTATNISGPTKHTGIKFWPPPKKLQQRFAQFLTDKLVGMAEGNLLFLPSLLGWLRAMDIYLLTPYRCKKFPRLGHEQNRRLFTSPILVCLNQLFTRSMTNRVKPNLSRPLNRGEYRLMGRTVGLLTAYLTYELLEIRVHHSPKQSDSSETDCPDEDEVSNLIFDYDETWIWQRISQFDFDLKSICLDNTIFPTLVQHLALLIKSQSPRVWYAPTLSQDCLLQISNLFPLSLTNQFRNRIGVQLVDSTWAACFLRLTQLGYSPAVELLQSDSELSRQVSQTEQFLDRVVPLTTLRNHFGLTYTEDCSNDLGWLVNGYLPSLNGRYTNFMFWRAPRDKALIL